MVQSKLAFTVSRRKKTKEMSTSTPEYHQTFQNQMDKSMVYVSNESMSLEEKWGMLKRSAYKSA